MRKIQFHICIQFHLFTHLTLFKTYYYNAQQIVYAILVKNGGMDNDNLFEWINVLNSVEWADRWNDWVEFHIHIHIHIHIKFKTRVKKSKSKQRKTHSSLWYVQGCISSRLLYNQSIGDVAWPAAGSRLWITDVLSTVRSSVCRRSSVRRS